MREILETYTEYEDRVVNSKDGPATSAESVMRPPRPTDHIGSRQMGHARE